MLTKIRNFLKNNEIEEALKLLDKFTQDSKYNNEIILNFNKFNRFKTSNRQGLISFDEFNREVNKLVFSISELTSEISKETFDSTFEFEKLISGDESNLVDIAFLEKALKAQKSVCKVKTVDGSGTGFLISESGLILTNNHVLHKKELLPKTKLIFNYQKDIYGNNKEIFEYILDTTYFKTNKKLDYSVVKIKEFKDKFKWGFLKLTRNIDINNKVYSIQHPKGEDKKIALINNKITQINKPYIRYEVDTLKGSSGSPIFNENFEVVALHHAGVNNIKVNQGILISSIFKL